MKRDLAKIHEPISQLFSVDSESAASFQLSAEQVQSFHERGFLAGIRILNELQLEGLRSALATLVDPSHDGQELWYEYNRNESTDPNTVLFHALGAWRVSEAFHDLLWHLAFTVPAAQLLGGDVRFWHDQLFCKPANHGGVVAWHQDYSYWTRTEPIAHLTCWIALDDSSIDNGCLQYIPGSHRWPLLPITGLSGDMLAVKKVLTDDQWHQLQSPYAVELKAGQCAFHHPLMVHGSGENRSSKQRRATVINAVRDGVRSNQPLPLLKGANVIETGQPLNGMCFPRLSE